MEKSSKQEKHPRVCTAAAVHHMLGSLELTQSKRLDYAQTALQMCTTNDPKEDHALVTALVRVGQEYYQLKNYKLAASYFEDAANLARKRSQRIPAETNALAPGDFNNAISFRLTAADLYQKLGNVKHATELRAEAERLLKLAETYPSLKGKLATAKDNVKVAKSGKSLID
jgi:tetratricopeptide (TPR) repeat protein